jgi:hypothetical protein
MTKLKSNSVISTEIEGTLLTISVLGCAPIKFDASACSQSNNVYAMMHGWKQRLCDTAAIGAEPGRSAAERAKEKYAAIKELADYYLTGEVPWKRVSAGGGGDGGLLLTALCRLRPNKTVEEVATFLESRNPEQLKAIKLRADVIEMIAKIKIERAPKLKSDALDGLDGDSEIDSEIAELISKDSEPNF